MAAETPLPLSFSDFLERMKDPAAADLVRHIKSFIKQFEDRPKNFPANPDADGTKVQEFMARSEQLFRTHPVWRGSLPAVLDQAVEGLEKYVMSKVWRATFGVGQEDRDRDERYARLLRALGGFVELGTLLGADAGDAVAPDPALLAMAQGELLKMDKYKAPRDKLLCLVNVKTMVESIVQQAAKQGAKVGGGADAFFPVFLFVVIRSCLPRLASNVEYVKRFRMASRLTGQFDFMLCNLESAAMYLDTVNYEHLRIPQDEFLARLAAAGIPEADLELRRLHRLQAAGGQGGGAVSSPRALEAYLRQQQQGQDGLAEAAGGMSAEHAPASPQPPAAAAAAGAVPHPGPAMHASPGAESAGGDEEQELGQGLSLPTTPVGSATAAAYGVALSTPVRSPQSPSAAASSAGAATAAGTAALVAEGLSPLPHATPGISSPRGLGEDGMSTLVSGLSLSDTLRRQVEAEQAQAQAAPPAAGMAVGGPRSSSVVDEMVAEGARYVAGEESRGWIQAKYPYMYAEPDDLTLGDVRQLLRGYQQLALRYESLALALHRQLGGGLQELPPPQPQQPQQQRGVDAGRARQQGSPRSSSPMLAGFARLSAGSSEEGAGGGSGGGSFNGSPTRRSLLQRITSRSGRSPTKAAGESGPAALLTTLFGSPQRQAGRKSMDASQPAAAPAAVAAAAAAAAVPAPPRPALPYSTAGSPSPSPATQPPGPPLVALPSFASYITPAEEGAAAALQLQALPGSDMPAAADVDLTQASAAGEQEEAGLEGGLSCGSLATESEQAEAGALCSQLASLATAAEGPGGATATPGPSDSEIAKGGEGEAASDADAGRPLLAVEGGSEAAETAASMAAPSDGDSLWEGLQLSTAEVAQEGEAAPGGQQKPQQQEQQQQAWSAAAGESLI